MRRRDFIQLIFGAGAAWPFAARAQETRKLPRVGFLYPGPQEAWPQPRPIDQGLRELGYTEGSNIVVERLYGDWDPKGFPSLAAELVRQKVDIIVVFSTSPARAVKQATSTIPIVVDGMADPVRDGLVASLARPGGNITGNTFLGPELIAKRFGLLKEAVPGLSHVAALWHQNAYGERTMARIVQDTNDAAADLGVQLQLVPVNTPGDLVGAFDAMTAARVGALISMPSPMLFREHRHIVTLAAKYRLPAMYNAREFVEVGGLMAYGANLDDIDRRCAIYVDKILKGAKPGDIPVEQPTKFELVINLETAKALGLTIPQSLIYRADEVIE
jgi:putative ABC transport system substrate-binding protein